jgi:Asp-tRNA(Asn)/Glu-tRNA(Gln) amidotransferase A subunit family amidase
MAAGVRTGELSAAGLVADALSAAAALDQALHFLDSLTPHSALAAAARIDDLPLGQRDGLSLAGVPFLAKAGTTGLQPVRPSGGYRPGRPAGSAGPLAS